MQQINFWEPDPNGLPQLIGGTFGGRTVEGSTCIHGNSLNDWVRQYHQGVLGLDQAVGRLVIDKLFYPGIPTQLTTQTSGNLHQIARRSSMVPDFGTSHRRPVCFDTI